MKRQITTFVVTIAVIGVGMRLSETRTGNVVLAVGLVVAALALAIAWLSGASRRPRGSVTNPTDVDFVQGAEPDYRSPDE